MSSLCKYSVLLVLVLHCFFARSQNERKVLTGNIKSNTNEIEGVNVQNINSKKGAITGNYGYFSIPVILNDTLIFSAVQFTKKILVVTQAILESKSIVVPLEDAENQLDEVVVMPYDLTGDLVKDADQLKKDVMSASTINLPNANAKIYTQADRHLHTARTWDFTGNSIKLDPIINYFSGRTKMLNRRVARDKKYKNLDVVVDFVTDSTFINGLKIPKENIWDFAFFCESDKDFDEILNIEDKIQLWQFLQKKSIIYRKNNDLE